VFAERIQRVMSDRNGHTLLSLLLSGVISFSVITPLFVRATDAIRKGGFGYNHV
jgi:hypothetical protein